MVVVRYNVWIKILVLTNLVSLIFLAIITFHYQVPHKVLGKLGIIDYYNPDRRHIARNELFSEYDYTYYRIVMLGDSITEWVSWNELLGITDIANRGIAGETTGMFYNRLSTVYSVNPEVCFIMGGINDIIRGIPLGKILNNMEAIIEKLEENEIKPIMQSTLYVSNERDGWKRINNNVDELNRGLKNICIEKGIMFLDVNTVLSVDGAIKNENVFDGLHLSGLGYREWGKLLLPIIENYLK